MPSAFSATRWVLLGSFGFRFISLGGQMLILRAVDKDVFGGYRGIVQIILMTLMLFPFSLDTLVVREKRIGARYTIALSIMLGIMGLALSALAFAAAMLPMPLAGSWAGQLLDLGPDAVALFFLPPILLVIATKLSIRAVLSARLDFKTISIGEFGNGIITWIGGAAAVLVVPSVWPLMLMYLLGELFECAWMYRGRPFRFPRILAPDRWWVFTRLLGRHWKYCSFNTANLWLNNVASLLPGVLFVALISREANADFSVAQQVLVLPTMLLAGALWRVAFPSMSGVPEEELQRRCLAIIRGTSAFIAPSVLWFAFFAPTTVAILAGQEYIESTPPVVRWLAVYMFMVAIFMPISSIEMIRDRPDLGLYWNIVYLIGRVTIIVLYAGEGLLAAISAYAIYSLFMWFVQIGICGWLLRAGWVPYLFSVLRFVPAWTVVAAGWALCLYATGGHLVYAPLASVLPGLAYLGIILWFHPGEGQLLHRLIGR